MQHCCSVSGVAFSFNGGKDSTVLLHIIRAAIALPLPERTADLNENDRGEFDKVKHSAYLVISSHFAARCPALAGLKGICSFVFERGDDFPQILDFTDEMSQQYGLNVHKLHADFRSGVESLLETTNLKAIILGTRRYCLLYGIFAKQPVACFAQHVWRIANDAQGHPVLALSMRCNLFHPQKPLQPAVPNLCCFAATQ